MVERPMLLFNVWDCSDPKCNGDETTIKLEDKARAWDELGKLTLPAELEYWHGTAWTPVTITHYVDNPHNAAYTVFVKEMGRNMSFWPDDKVWRLARRDRSW